MKKKQLIILIPALLLICAILFYIFQYFNKSFEDLLGTMEVSITKVIMRNGKNGSFVETEDKEKIKEILILVNDRHYKKSFSQSKRVGYSYYYDFYSGDNRIIRITGNGTNVDINGTYYNVSKPISVDLLTNWFKSLSVNAYK